MQARISVITPVLNRARFIKGCIENVAAQGIEGIEHIVMDGGSTDGTVAILEELSRQYPHLRYVSQKDAGQADAMNKGTALATSNIVGILNVDDFYEPGAIAEAVEFLEQNPAVDFVTGDCNVRNEMDAVTHINRPRDLRPESILLGWEYAQHPVNPSAYFYRKSVHEAVGGYPVSERYSLDLCFLYACFAKVKTAYQPRLWGNFRELPETKTTENRLNGPKMDRRVQIQYIGQLPLARQIPIRARRLLWKARRAYWKTAKSFEPHRGDLTRYDLDWYRPSTASPPEAL